MICARSLLATGRMLGAVLATFTIVALTHARVAMAEPNTWGPIENLPVGSEPASDQILSSPTGALMRYSTQEGFASLASFEPDGVLGPEQPVGGATSSAVRGPVAFLPDGAAVISFESFSSGPLDLTVRLPNGAYGPRFEGNSDKPIVAFAVREGEVLLARVERGSTNDKITVSSLAIGAGGELTETGASRSIYELPAEDTAVAIIRSVAVALDSDGQAEVVTLTEGERYGNEPDAHNEVLAFSRSAQGEWSGPRQLSAGLFEEKHANQLQVAVAPGGRALLTFQDGKYPAENSGGADQLADDVYQSVREPGGTFSTPTVVQSIAGQGGVEFKTQVAAGGDGTLAESVRSYSCQIFEDTSEVPNEAISVLVAGPGKPFVSHAIPVFDTAAESTAVRVPAVLGAGVGEALLGVQDRASTAGRQTNVCGSEQSEERGRVEDRAVLVGEHEGSEKTFGSGEYQIGSELSTANLSIGAAGIDTAGDAAVTGSLAMSSGAEYDYFTGPPHVGVGAGSGESKGGGSSSGGSTTGTGASASGSVPAGAPSGTSQASGAATTTISTSGFTVTVSGSSVTLPAIASCSNATTSACTVTTTATVPAANAAAAASVISRVTRNKHRRAEPVTVGKGSLTLTAGATGRLHLTLTSSGLAMLRDKHTLNVTVTVTVAGHGRPTTTRTLHFQLKLKQAAKKKPKTKHHSG